MYKEKVSIIIPTYNRANTIKRAIDSVLRQTYNDFELLVVDDGSTDDTPQIVGSYEDSRVRYFRTGERHGANHARNVGIKNAGGEYIAFQDSDDFWLEDKLEKQMHIFEKDPQVDVVWCRYVRLMISGAKRVEPKGMFIKDRMQTETEKVLAAGNVIGTPTMIVRKKCFEQVGAFDETIQRFQDWELCIRFIQKFQFYFMDEILVEAYESEHGITNANSMMASLLSIVKKHALFFEANGSIEKHIARLIELAAEEKCLEDLLESIGDTLFLRGIYTYARKYISLKKNFSFVREWLQKGDSTECINQYFAKFPENSVIIYGMGEIGRLLLNTMSEDSKKRVGFIIDQNVNVLTEYKMITLEQLKNIDEKSIECIVVTAVAHETEIRKSIEQITTVPVVGLYDIIAKK